MNLDLVRPSTMKRRVTAPCLALAAAIVSGLTATSAEAHGGCTNTSVQVIIAPLPNPGSSNGGGIYGDGSTYVDGSGGVTAYLSTCDLSGDFVLNLQNSPRSFTVDFSTGPLVVSQDVGATIRTGLQPAWFMKIMGLGLAQGNGVPLKTWMPVNLTQAPTSGSIVMCPSSFQDSSGSYPCQSGRAPVADRYTDTSVVDVTVVKNGTQCTWTATPEAVPLYAPYPLGGLIEQSSAKKNPTLVNGGSYVMPFTVTVTGACVN